MKDNYSPYKYITYYENGVIILTKDYPDKVKVDIYNYFSSRNEDES